MEEFFVKMIVSRVILCLVILSLMITGNIVTAASNIISVVVDGKSVEFDVLPFIDSSSRTMVPIRMVSQEMGAHVDWNNEKQIVTIKHNTKTILLKIGESKATMNGKGITLDTKAVVKKGRTFVPLRFVSEALGATVKWDGKYKVVYITTKGEMESASSLEQMIRSFESFNGTTRYNEATGNLLVNLGTDQKREFTMKVSEGKTTNDLYITVYFLSESEKNLIIDFLKKFYPNSYSKAYNNVLSKKRVDTVYDGRNFETYVAGNNNDVYVIIIGMD
jgi:hypothetical protein